MDMILFLVLTLTVFGNVTCLDFSQFYLPPCCYISPQGDHFSGYASPSNKGSVNIKREVSYLENTSPIHADSIHNYTGFGSRTNRKINKTLKNASSKRVYSLIIPLDEIIHKKTTTSTTELPETTQIKPPTTGKILLPERRNEVSKFKRDSNPIVDKTKLLEEVLTLELEDVENRRSHIGKKSLVDGSYQNSATLQPEHRTISDQDEKQYESWEPKKIRNKVTAIYSQSPSIKLQVIGKHDTLLVSNSENSVKRQAVKKMPASWLKNLRRAIYQSIAASDKPRSYNQEIPSQDKTKHQSSLKNSIIYPKTWKSIQAATLQYVDKMSQVASDLNSAIFLPQGQGPVVSGVLVNANEGGLQLRVASELHSYDGSNPNDVSPGCHCYLVNNGEILVAYWSVSRVFNENGQPALQYLVFPLPFSVPTPPDYIPFYVNQAFRPSQIDPLTNYYEQIHRIKSHEHQHQLEIRGHNHIDNFQAERNLHGHRSPKLFHELPHLGHHQLELMPIPSPIPNIPMELPPGPEHQGVIVEKNGQYTPEFVKLYQEAVQHHLKQQDEDQRRMTFQGPGPFPSNGAMEGPINYQANPPFPTRFMDTPEEFVQPRPPLLPDPTSFPVQNDQISRPPTYPNSIQDIISPFPHAYTNTEFSINLLEQVPEGQLPLPPQQVSVQLNPAINPQQFLNQERVSNQPQHEDFGAAQPYPPSSVQSIGQHPNKKKNNYRDKTTDSTYYDDNPKGNDNTNYSQRPYKVSNVLDNEKKYYPQRKPTSHFVNSFSESKTPYKRRLTQRIDNARGYLLDF